MKSEQNADAQRGEVSSTAVLDDLPGMIQLAQGVRDQRWPHTVDARVWADEWEKTLAQNPSIATDKGCMIGWFANAIMAGYDTASLRSSNIAHEPPHEL